MHVLFFDGVCGLCDRAVKFILRRDREERFKFAPLQSDIARDLLLPRNIDPSRLDTVVVVAHFETPREEIYVRSRAALFAISELGGIYALIKPLTWLPSWLLDPLYALVAKVRYRLFGKADACMVPTPKERSRFLAINAEERALEG